MSLRGWEGHGDQCSEVGAHVHKGPADGVGSRGLRLEEGSAPQSLQSPGTQLSSPLLCHPAKDGPSAAPNTPQMAPRRPALVQAQVRPRPTLLCCPEGLTEKLGLQRPPTHHCHLHTCRPHPRPRLGRRALSRFRDVSREGWQWYRGALKRGLLAGHGATASGTMRSLAAAT